MPAITVPDLTVLPRVPALLPNVIQRPVVSITSAPSAFEGEGFPVKRAFAGVDLKLLDPFIHLDEMGEVEYAPGEPKGTSWHPHRGFETVTYMLDGRMRHKDNHGNEGLLTPGSVQWMTAGRGLIHSEMPEQESGRMRGFQLWVNLPARDKMADPKYQEYAPENIPVAQPASGVSVKVIAGKVGEVTGPIVQPATDPVYLDISLDVGKSWEYALPEGHNAFAYVFEGAVTVGEGDDARALETHEMAVLGGGDLLQLRAGKEEARLIVVAGRPLREPVMRHGPFVMNTKEELMQAFVDYQEGRF